jgi:hypothetical protein
MVPAIAVLPLLRGLVQRACRTRRALLDLRGVTVAKTAHPAAAPIARATFALPVALAFCIDLF